MWVHHTLQCNGTNLRGWWPSCKVQWPSCPLCVPGLQYEKSASVDPPPSPQRPSTPGPTPHPSVAALWFSAWEDRLKDKTQYEYYIPWMWGLPDIIKSDPFWSNNLSKVHLIIHYQTFQLHAFRSMKINITFNLVFLSWHAFSPN